MHGRRQKYDSVAFELGSSSKAWSVYTVLYEYRIKLGLDSESRLARASTEALRMIQS